MGVSETRVGRDRVGPTLGMFVCIGPDRYDGRQVLGHANPT